MNGGGGEKYVIEGAVEAAAHLFLQQGRASKDTGGTAGVGPGSVTQ